MRQYILRLKIRLLWILSETVLIEDENTNNNLSNFTKIVSKKNKVLTVH